MIIAFSSKDDNLMVSHTREKQNRRKSSSGRIHFNTLVRKIATDIGEKGFVNKNGLGIESTQDHELTGPSQANSVLPGYSLTTK